MCALKTFLLEVFCATFFQKSGIYNTKSGKNKKINLIFSSVTVLCLSLLLAYFYSKMDKSITLSNISFELYKLFRFDSVEDRIQIFNVGIQDFLSYPILGVGWNKGALDESVRFENFFSNMYHCLPIQLGASAGVCGLLSLLFHVKDIFIVALKKFSLDRLFVLSVPVMVLCMSLVDNFFFYLNFQIFYLVFLALAEKHMESKKAPDSVTA